jgi:FAD:protein FMN transferase
MAEVSSLRRCQPLLGTLVEISAAGDLPGVQLTHAVQHAFVQIQRVHACMSLFDPDSELSRLNASAHQYAVATSPLLGDVVRLALHIARASDGAFDPTAAVRAQGDFRHVTQHDDMVQFQRPLQLDLNGIAKGFAVDLAAAVLIAAGVSRGVVNAGGDLRVFGAQTIDVNLRDPNSGALTNARLALRNQALCTSGGKLHWRAQTHSTRRRPTLLSTRGGFRGAMSVSVIADSAAVSDALTKVALLAPKRSAAILSRFNAVAHYLTPN